MRIPAGTNSVTTGGRHPSYVCKECFRVRRKQSDVDSLVEGIVVGRLQKPDAAQLFAQGDPLALRDARDSIETLDARLANAADMFATGDIGAGQLARVTERLRTERVRAAAAVDAALPAAVPAELMSSNAEQVWGGLSVDSKRAVLTALVTVTIMPSGSGKKLRPGHRAHRLEQLVPEVVHRGIVVRLLGRLELLLCQSERRQRSSQLGELGLGVEALREEGLGIT